MRDTILVREEPMTDRKREHSPAGAPSRHPAVEAACRFINAYDGVPTLAEIAEAVGLSPAHFQRLFTRTLGISPRDYADQRRLERVRGLLRQGDDVAGALYEAGYGSSSRLYEDSDAKLGMTPATYRKGGEGAEIFWATGESSLGRTIVAATEKGVCFVALDDSDEPLLDELRREFPAASIRPDPDLLAGWLAEVLRRIDGAPAAETLPLDVRSTAFQRRVWQALTEIPMGETRTYSQLAASLGSPKGQRAVGRACATNPVSILIPCHRAIREDGGLGGYRWGLRRKQKLLATEEQGARRR